MRVHELIEKLQGLPPDAVITGALILEEEDADDILGVTLTSVDIPYEPDDEAPPAGRTSRDADLMPTRTSTTTE